MLDFILNNKPVLVGLHLGFAIAGIDAMLWLLGEFVADPIKRTRIKIAAWLSLIGLALSWVIGGYYYVNYYGVLVKPEILKGSAPWAHLVAMEAKEHIFLFLIPIGFLILCVSMLNREQFNQLRLKKPIVILVLVSVIIALSLGLMGYMISAAARWGVI